MEIKFKDESEKRDNGSNKDDKNKKEKKEIKLTDVPRCDIYNAEKKITEKDPRWKKGEFNYEPLQYYSEKEEKYYPLTYENIYRVILAGSVVSGVDGLSTITISNMGIGLPSIASLLIIKAAKGFKPNPIQVFSASEIDSFSEVVVQEYVDPDYDSNSNNGIANNTIKPDAAKDVFDDITVKIDPNDFEPNGIEINEDDLV